MQCIVMLLIMVAILLFVATVKLRLLFHFISYCIYHTLSLHSVHNNYCQHFCVTVEFDLMLLLEREHCHTTEW